MRIILVLNSFPTNINIKCKELAVRTLDFGLSPLYPYHEECFNLMWHFIHYYLNMKPMKWDVKEFECNVSVSWNLPLITSKRAVIRIPFDRRVSSILMKPPKRELGICCLGCYICQLNSITRYPSLLLQKCDMMLQIGLCSGKFNVVLQCQT
jgi:hypothetical protein